MSEFKRGDIVVLKDGVDPVEVILGGTSRKRSINADRIHPDTRYKVGSTASVCGNVSVHTLRGGYLGIIADDQLEKVGSAATVDDFIALAAGGTVTPVNHVQMVGDGFTLPPDLIRGLTNLMAPRKARPPVEPVEVKEEPAPEPGTVSPTGKPWTWGDVVEGDQVTAETVGQRIGGVEYAHRVSGPAVISQDYRTRNHLVWNGLDLSVHRRYDSWKIISLFRAKPRTLAERRNPQRFGVTRIVPGDKVWDEAEVETDQLGYVEQDLDGHYWFYFKLKDDHQDLPARKIRLKEGRDKLFHWPVPSRLDETPTSFIKAVGLTHHAK